MKSKRKSNETIDYISNYDMKMENKRIEMKVTDDRDQNAL